MATVLVNVDDFLTVLHALADADATMQDTDHLTSSGRIHKSRKPAGATNPCVVLRASVQVDPDGIRRHDPEVYALAFADNVGDEKESPDSRRLGRVVIRLVELLEKANYTASGVRIHTLKTRAMDHPLFDAREPAEHYGFARLTGIISKT